MTGNDEAWTRSDFARWFVEHDEVDEAARLLEPGDELELGRSDYLNLEAALRRRGLTARSQGRRVWVQAPAHLVTGERRSPQRMTGATPLPAKKMG